MTEKRFVLEISSFSGKHMKFLNILDNGKRLKSEDIVDLLNEQQATIKKQLDQIIELQDKYRILEFNHSRLEKRNKAQYEKIGEQQAHINKLRKILAEAEDTIEVRLAEHYLKEYENIKQNIIGDNDD